MNAIGLYLVLALFDRTTKWYTMHAAPSFSNVLPGVFFERSLNRGAFAGLFGSSHPFYFALLTLFVSVVLIGFVWYTYQLHQRSLSIGPNILILIGAISNFLDRFIYGGVVDFILLSYHGWSWPTFNLADVYIVGGVFALLVLRWND